MICVPLLSSIICMLLMSSSALPPLGNLPSWSRVSTLDRSRYPKPFLRDRLQTLPPAGNNTLPSGEKLEGCQINDFQIIDNLSPAEQQRILYYNKSVKFLQQQHADTLKKLHEEIDSLKQENKGIVTMCLCLDMGCKDVKIVILIVCSSMRTFGLTVKLSVMLTQL